MKKTWKQVVAVVLTIVIMTTSPGFTAFASEYPAEGDLVNIDEAQDDISSDVPEYNEYELEQSQDVVEEVTSSDSDAVSPEDASYEENAPNNDDFGNESDSNESPVEDATEDDGENNSDLGEDGTSDFYEMAEPDDELNSEDSDNSCQIVDEISQDDEIEMEPMASTVGAYDVGDGVTADFDESTGAVVLYSNNGTLAKNWLGSCEINRHLIQSIKPSESCGIIYLPADSEELFYECWNLTYLDCSKFNTSKVTDMDSMFEGCSSLTNVDLSSFNTSNVVYMGAMFKDCWRLTNLDLSGFSTSNVLYMNEMFKECSSLTSLNLSSFDTSNVYYIQYMFGGCSSLTNLELSKFDTSKVEDMSGMFAGCSSLINLNLSSFDTLNVQSMDTMFNGCTGLTNLDLSSFDTSNVESMSYMFSRCSSLTNLDLSSFDTSNVEHMSYMFSWCSSLANLDLSSFNTSNVTYMECMFYGCSSLTNLDLSGFNTSNVKEMFLLFEGCSSLTNLDLSSFNTSNVTSMQGIFSGCSSLTNLDLSGFVKSNVEDIINMFKECSSLSRLDLSNCDFDNVTKANDSFSGCDNLQLLLTPRNNQSQGIALPHPMYDSAGNEYNELPVRSDSIRLTYQANTVDISTCTITLSPTTYTYDGKAKEPSVTVKNGTNSLVENTDYTVTYDSNINAGKATVTVTGKNNFTGTKTAQFTINKATPSLTFANSSVTKKPTDAAFTNTLTKKTDGTVTFTSSNTDVATVNSSNGEVTIKSVGSTTITATAAEGKNYNAGSTSFELTIVRATSYTVTYNANGGTGTPSSQEKEENVALVLSNEIPTKRYVISYNANGGTVSPASKNISCTFLNWNTAKNGSGTSYASGGRYTGNTDITLYAQWTNPKAGTLAKPTRSGYEFMGWFTSASEGQQITDSSTVTKNITLYAHWADPYNLGDETYSFENYVDSDSHGGHCFGMSITSAGYYNSLLNIGRIGGNANTPLYSFNRTQIVKEPICYYQRIQGRYSANAIVAGGSSYLTGHYDISSDWKAAVNFVKNHNYDNTGLLQIGFRKENVGGHAINFLRYENVNGQDRLYAYDNNFPNTETYFYKDSYGRVLQAPVQSFSGSIDCIALRDVREYFRNVKDFDSTHVLYMAKDAATVQGYTYTYMEGDISDEEYVMYEIPADQDRVIIIPNRDNADFIYMDTEYSFGNITDETRGELRFASLNEGASGSDATFRIYETGSILSTPKLTKVECNISGVKLTWDKVIDAEKYRIFRKTYTASTKKWSGWAKIADTTAVQYTDKTVATGTKYKYTVRCISADGGTYTSDYDKTGKTITYVAAPTISKITNVSGGVKVEWPKTAGASKYRVFRKTGSGKWTKLADTASVNYTDKTAVNGKTYAYTVRCLNSSGKYASAYNTTGKTITYVLKPAVSSLTSPKAKQMLVKWAKNKIATGYQIQYSTNSSFTSGKKTVTVKGASNVSKTITDLKTKKNYYVRIRTYKTVEGKKYYSAWSAKKKVTIK